MKTLVNQIHISGRVATEPSQKGNGPAKFRLAHGGGKAKGGKEYATQFFSVTCWDTAVTANLRKGEPVEVWGKLRDAFWTMQDGTKRSAVEIVADTIQTEEKQEPTPNATPNIHGVPITDADIPF